MAFQGLCPWLNFRRPCGTFGGGWLDWIVEPEGVIKSLTVRHLVLRQLRRSGLSVANGSRTTKSPVGAACSAAIALLRSFGFWRIGIYKYVAPMGLRYMSLAGRGR